MAADKLAFSAPSAYIVIDGKPAGYVQSIQATENYNRVECRGIGEVFAKEVPIVSANVSFSLGFIYIDFDLPYMRAMIDRRGGVKALKDTLTLGDLPFSIAVYKKLATGYTGKLVTETDNTGKEVIALRDCFVDNQNWSLNEGGLAMSNCSGRAITPIANG